MSLIGTTEKANMHIQIVTIVYLQFVYLQFERESCMPFCSDVEGDEVKVVCSDFKCVNVQSALAISRNDEHKTNTNQDEYRLRRTCINFKCVNLSF